MQDFYVPAVSDEHRLSVDLAACLRAQGELASATDAWFLQFSRTLPRDQRERAMRQRRSASRTRGELRGWLRDRGWATPHPRVPLSVAKSRGADHSAAIRGLHRIYSAALRLARDSAYLRASNKGIVDPHLIRVLAATEDVAVGWARLADDIHAAGRPHGRNSVESAAA